MTGYTDYFAWLDHGKWIRASARAIIFNQIRDHTLIERNHGVQNEYANFIGGGLEIGETLQACIERELIEETNARSTHAKYLFVVENFMNHQSKVRHSLEHYFEITLDREDVVPTNSGIVYTWIPIAELAVLDLRPVVVRDCIVDGTYGNVGHMILNDRDDE